MLQYSRLKKRGRGFQGPEFIHDDDVMTTSLLKDRAPMDVEHLTKILDGCRSAVPAAGQTISRVVGTVLA